VCIGVNGEIMLATPTPTSSPPATRRGRLRPAEATTPVPKPSESTSLATNSGRATDLEGASMAVSSLTVWFTEL
jgi:hypothetical protein